MLPPSRNSKEMGFRMPELRRLINAQVSALIDGSFGCLDAAASAIDARLNSSVSKGTLSKRLQLQYGWPVDEIIALEDAAGRHPITRMMARRMSPDSETASGSILMHASCVSKETGEAIGAILAAVQSEAGNETAQVIVEIDEAIEALQRARAVVVSRSIGSEQAS
ncbi:hypothetical protein [Roseovarius indicus]|uniref:hypothetical protein n=1 Tax=Roseovarius indicus TaxID=540747 RepID=UPI0032EAB61D